MNAPTAAAAAAPHKISEFELGFGEVTSLNADTISDAKDCVVIAPACPLTVPPRLVLSDVEAEKVVDVFWVVVGEVF
jgi:hypothetical protein